MTSLAGDPKETDGEGLKSPLPGMVLAALACLPIAGTFLVAQVLPQMERAFAGAPQLRLQVSLALIAPAAMIAVSSWLGGWAADRLGKRKLLVGALVFYAVLGLAPLALSSLSSIILVRAAMGLMEGLILTCSTAIIGDLYTAGRREGLLSLQTAIASGGAVAFALIGGALGEFGWRTPFYVYGAALVFVPAVLLLTPNDGGTSPASRQDRAEPPAPPLPLGALAGVCFITVILSIAFHVAQIQLPFLLNGIGVLTPAAIGAASAFTNVAVVMGTISFIWLRRLPLRVTGALCFLVMAAGLLIASRGAALVPTCAGLALASFAGGVGLPTMIVAAMKLLNPRQRGLGSGIWQSSFWAGQFFSPILVVPITAATGSLGNAVAVFAGLCALFVAVSLPILGRGGAAAAPATA